MKLLVVLLTSISACITSHSSVKELHFLAALWKVENKQNFEEWKLNEQGFLEGSSYKFIEGQKQVSEFLSITERSGQVIYTARVINQNQGLPVEFVLNKGLKDKFSFENPGHDFPRKIQYSRLNDSTLLVAVLGEGDRGFSYKMMKQK